MAISSFIPEIWSANVQDVLQRSNVAGQVVNRDYQGDITRAGDTVHITQFGDITVSDYTAHSDITIEDVDDATKALLIDQAKYFAFEVDDVEAAQSVNGGQIMTRSIARASHKLATAFDAYVFGLMGAGSGTSVSEATIAAAGDAYESIVEWGVALDENDAPEAGRFAVVSPAFYGWLLKDARFVSAGDAAGAEARSNGRVGSAAGFSIYKSNNLAAGATTGSLQIAGVVEAMTVAEQVTKVESFKQEKRFNEGVKGLHLYGGKVIEAAGLVSADIIA